MKKASLCLGALLLYAADPGGIPPRPAVGDYAAQQAGAGYTIAVSPMTAERARKLFGYDLNRAGYLVLEVAIFPDGGASVEAAPDKFVLSVPEANGKTDIIPSSNPVAVAGSIFKEATPPPQLPGNVHVVTNTTIGYESGPYHRGVYTGSGVGVAVGDPGTPQPPPSQGTDRSGLESLLASMEFPVVKASAPVAGYLYFAKPSSKSKSGSYDLMFYGPNRDNVTVSVPAK
jgi:hypothetical protein